MKLITFVGLLSLLITTSALAQSKQQHLTQYNNVLFKGLINKGDGEDVLIREALFPPNWKAPRHYHNANLFIYVIEGAFEVELQGHNKITYKAGEALQMQAGIEMEARNPNSKMPLKLAVFQIGNPDAPFVVPVEPQN